ncbi:hypothetical protein HK097_009816 [Rhizophlyctis rosea]|uniref:Uncharacterized protein n=1 Tax=Rhizophlyctis rosea TaxID=64517 RepID=A0AAD5SB74_9FUNG|nr:hypothetical protein HK097_009816 [Rhizophlyctis rosea]
MRLKESDKRLNRAWKNAARSAEVKQKAPRARPAPSSQVVKRGGRREVVKGTGDVTEPKPDPKLASKPQKPYAETPIARLIASELANFKDQLVRHKEDLRSRVHDSGITVPDPLLDIPLPTIHTPAEPIDKNAEEDRSKRYKQLSDELEEVKKQLAEVSQRVLDARKEGGAAREVSHVFVKGDESHAILWEGSTQVEGGLVGRKEEGVQVDEILSQEPPLITAEQPQADFDTSHAADLPLIVDASRDRIPASSPPNPSLQHSRKDERPPEVITLPPSVIKTIRNDRKTYARYVKGVTGIDLVREEDEGKGPKAWEVIDKYVGGYVSFCVRSIGADAFCLVNSIVDDVIWDLVEKQTSELWELADAYVETLFEEEFEPA